MKLTFLGFSHGVPEPNRQCACTLLELAGRYYIADMITGGREISL